MIDRIPRYDNSEISLIYLLNYLLIYLFIYLFTCSNYQMRQPRVEPCHHHQQQCLLLLLLVALVVQMPQLL